jgi:hypothetical protein
MPELSIPVSFSPTPGNKGTKWNGGKLDVLKIGVLNVHSTAAMVLSRIDPFSHHPSIPDYNE